jgi:hypothetical protein
MRLIDLANCWTHGTLKTYSGRISTIRKFERVFSLRVLATPSMVRPPTHEAIPLMWLQEQYSLRKSSRQIDPSKVETISHGTVRQFRSAAAQHLAWRQVVTDPAGAYYDRQKRLIGGPIRHTDAASNTMFATGMSARLGTKTQPSVALLDRHIRSLDQDLRLKYLASTNTAQKRLYARAGLANLNLWLGWLRSGELFDSRWTAFTVVEPGNGPSVDLPVNVGAILQNLGATKTDRSQAADVIMAYATLSGYELGWWFTELRNLVDPNAPLLADYRRLFGHDDGTPWTSRYFRETFLYPSLYAQRAAGDPFLLAFDGTPGNRIDEKFWSLHCYRRGARSHVSRSQGKFRKATKTQVYEHARWRRRRSSEDIDIMYREWTLRDRIKITLYSM